jgi:hypothetical protein
MGVLSRVRDALEAHRDDDVVAERGLRLLGLLAEADDNKVNVASALSRVFLPASLGVSFRYAFGVAACVLRGCVCCGTGPTDGCTWNRCGGAGRPSGAVGGR